MVAVSPITDLTLSSPSIDSPAGENMPARPVLEHITAQYLDGAAPDRSPQSPLHGDLADLPPLLIVAGGDEALLDDARRFADAASAAGTLVTLDLYQDMVHAFHLPALPEAPPQVAIMFLDRLTAWTTALPGAGIALGRDRELIHQLAGRPDRRTGGLVRAFTRRFRGNAIPAAYGSPPGRAALAVRDPAFHRLRIARVHRGGIGIHLG